MYPNVWFVFAGGQTGGQEIINTSHKNAEGFKPSAFSCLILVPEAGVEPARPCGRGILSPVRLPIPPPGHDKHRCIDRIGEVILRSSTTFPDHCTEFSLPNEEPFCKENPIINADRR